jgi:hypothetical protein
MAILPAVPGLDVCLRVDGELALERTAAGDEVVMEDRYVVKYIECRPGSKFGVSIEFAPLFTYYTWTTMAAHIYIDGALTNRRTFPKHRLVGDFLEEITGAEDFDNNGEQVQREFVFAATEIGLFATLYLFLLFADAQNQWRIMTNPSSRKRRQNM